MHSSIFQNTEAKKTLSYTECLSSVVSVPLCFKIFPEEVEDHGVQSVLKSKRA